MFDEGRNESIDIGKARFCTTKLTLIMADATRIGETESVKK